MRRRMLTSPDFLARSCNPPPQPPPCPRAAGCCAGQGHSATSAALSLRSLPGQLMPGKTTAHRHWPWLVVCHRPPPLSCTPHSCEYARARIHHDCTCTHMSGDAHPPNVPSSRRCGRTHKGVDPSPLPPLPALPPSAPAPSAALVPWLPRRITTPQIVYGGAGYQGPMGDIWIFNSLQVSQAWVSHGPHETSTGASDAPAREGRNNSNGRCVHTAAAMPCGRVAPIPALPLATHHTTPRLLQGSWNRAAVSGPQPPAREMHTGCMVNSRTLLIYGGRGPEFK